MQKRHIDRERYFVESSMTSNRYYLPYIKIIRQEIGRSRVLEIGCGEGGNLKPFAEAGCEVVGIDMASSRIEQAQRFFAAEKLEGMFVCCDFLSYSSPENEAGKFDIIILHDVIEHVPDKYAFMRHVGSFLRREGVVFVAFPAWQMPFGGHQQICRSRFWSKIPFYHLLPYGLYPFVLERLAHESAGTVRELLCIKICKCPVELFEKVVVRCGLRVASRQLWLVNPHYEQKFGLKPRRLPSAISHVPFIRDFFSTSCFYLLMRR